MEPHKPVGAAVGALSSMPPPSSKPIRPPKAAPLPWLWGWLGKIEGKWLPRGDKVLPSFAPNGTGLDGGRLGPEYAVSGKGCWLVPPMRPNEPMPRRAPAFGSVNISV